MVDALLGTGVAVKLGEQRTQRQALDELHRVVPVAALSPECVNRNDVGVVESTGGARLALEPLDRTARAGQ